MGAIQVRNVGEDEHEAVRCRAAEAGLTVGEYVMSLIRRDLSVPLRHQWFERVQGRAPVPGLESATTLEQVRTERADQVGDAVGD